MGLQLAASHCPVDSCSTSKIMQTHDPATPAALYRMIPIPEAQKLVLQETPINSTQTLNMHEALGAVLAEDLTANDDLPPFPASIKDGYAVRYADGAGEFEVEFEALAGQAQRKLSEGKIAYIGTGGPVPDGADAVVQIENTEKVVGSSARVKILKAASAVGEDIRAIGSDIKVDQVVLQKGETINAAEIGILATVGFTALPVYRRPKVGVLSTGDELVEPNSKVLGPGQIRDANRSMLLAAISAASAIPVDLGIAKDTQKDVEDRFNQSLEQEVDILLTTGGVSMGDKDFVKPLLERNATVHFGKVKMKPGKPLTFATLDLPRKDGGGKRRMLVFGLPGNPVSSIVTFQLVVLAALRKMAGHPEPELRRVHARTIAPLKLDPVRPEYHRATLEWQENADGQSSGFVAHSTGGQISSRLLSMRSAVALLELPQEKGVLPAGSTVTALLISDLRSMPFTQIKSSQ